MIPTPAVARALKRGPGRPKRNLKEEYILDYLHQHAYGQSIPQRQAAVEHLNRMGVTDEQISTALANETRRLEAFTDHLKNPPGFRNWRELAAQAATRILGPNA